MSINTTKATVLLILTSLLSLWSCQSGKKAVNQTEASKKSAPKADAKSPELEKSLLWEISGNGLTQSSYLYGTIHMIAEEDYFLPSGTLSAIDQSKELVFEIDMDDMTDMSKLMPLMQKAYMKDNLTIKDVMSADDYAIVKAHFKKMGMPLFMLERMKPLFLSVFASGDAMDIKSGNIKSYEMELQKIAKESGKSTGGLETIEYQLAIFDSIPYTDQAQMLVEAIKSTDSGNDQLEALVKLYKEQDVQGLYNAMKNEESIEEYEDVLLNQRNKNWIPIMSKMMQEQCTFFAVGAGHLGGPMGVIKLLQDQGYKVAAYRG